MGKSLAANTKSGVIRVRGDRDKAPQVLLLDRLRADGRPLGCVVNRDEDIPTSRQTVLIDHQYPDFVGIALKSAAHGPLNQAGLGRWSSISGPFWSTVPEFRQVALVIRSHLHLHRLSPVETR